MLASLHRRADPACLSTCFSLNEVKISLKQELDIHCFVEPVNSYPGYVSQQVPGLLIRGARGEQHGCMP